MKDSKINRVIWTYDEGLSADLDKSLTTWEQNAPDWTINVITPENLSKYKLRLPSTFYLLPLNLKSNCVQMEVLRRFGGLWLNSNVLLEKDIAWLEEYVTQYTRNFAGFAHNASMSTWLIYSPKKYDPFIKRWRDVFFDSVRAFPDYQRSEAFSIETYSDDVLEQTYLYLLKTDCSFQNAVASNPLIPGGGLNMGLYPDPFGVRKCSLMDVKWYRFIMYELLAVLTLILIVILLVMVSKHGKDLYNVVGDLVGSYTKNRAYQSPTSFSR